ncbi:hypothetical protein O181_128017 [Austropuccinia psidii MF-1]|uniref:Uncharacterized protein n=1 Tax=Austropuccinia psidii MF-1 TaxID=1389203 RepID=A0A9Q3KZ12_9BASI|nr:hypothetical protein [Austropuccinia psidii MF-1]
MQIYLGEDSRTIKDGKELIHWRNRIPGLPSDSITFAVVNTQTEATILFFNKKDSLSCSPGRISRQSLAIDFTSHRTSTQRQSSHV